MEQLSSEAVQGCMDKSDMQEVETHCAALKDQVQEDKDVQTFVFKFLAKHNKRMPARTLPDGSISQEVAQASLPPRSRIYRDLCNGRWRCWYKLGETRRDRSVSWGHLGDERLCVATLLQWVWALHIACSGGACPVKGLLKAT